MGLRRFTLWNSLFFSVHEGVQWITSTASRDHGGDNGEVLLLVYLLFNTNRIVYLQLFWASTRFQAGGLGGFTVWMVAARRELEMICSVEPCVLSLCQGYFAKDFANYAVNTEVSGASGVKAYLDAFWPGIFVSDDAWKSINHVVCSRAIAGTRGNLFCVFLCWPIPCSVAINGFVFWDLDCNQLPIPCGDAGRLYFCPSVFIR